MNEITPFFPERPPRPAAVMQPCSEACTAFRLLSPDHWSEYGLCLNPHSPRCGYPVRVGHECAHFCPTLGSGLSHAN